jgi:hypothetical protein
MTSHSQDFQVYGTDKFELLIPVDKATFFKLVGQASEYLLHVDDYCTEALKALAENHDDFERFYTIGNKPADTNDNIAF